MSKAVAQGMEDRGPDSLRHSVTAKVFLREKEPTILLWVASNAENFVSHHSEQCDCVDGNFDCELA